MLTTSESPKGDNDRLDRSLDQSPQGDNNRLSDLSPLDSEDQKDNVSGSGTSPEGEGKDPNDATDGLEHADGQEGQEDHVSSGNNEEGEVDGSDTVINGSDTAGPSNPYPWR